MTFDYLLSRVISPLKRQIKQFFEITPGETECPARAAAVVVVRPAAARFPPGGAMVWPRVTPWTMVVVV